MREIYQDRVSHNFIEGPIQSEPVNNNFASGMNQENTTYPADLTGGSHQERENINANFSEQDANERYD